MVAEIVEAYEERTGKRAEGTFYAGNWLVTKAATGGGILLTGLIVSQVGLEPGTPQSEVAAEVPARLALAYLLVTAGLTMFAAFWLARFPISREQHEARVAARLQGARAAAAALKPDK
jgi:GPH family glycoside/pentoside/hexuronide:cation symporter